MANHESIHEQLLRLGENSQSPTFMMDSRYPDITVWEPYIYRELQRHRISYAVLSAIAYLPDEMDLVISSGDCRTYCEWITQRLTERLRTIIKEWPYDIQTEGMDKPQLAYTRNPKHGELDRQTVTSPGKYLNRLFPEIPGHIVEMLAYPTPPKVEILVGQAMIDAMYAPGPGSCMFPVGGRRLEDARPMDMDRVYHPYWAYAERHGWGMAVSYNTDRLLVGRAIVHIPSKTFVRIFGNNDQHEIRADNPGLRYWLTQNGYQQVDGWSGRTLAYIPFFGNTGNSMLAPYLDGNICCGYIQGNDLVINSARYDLVSLHSTMGIVATVRNGYIGDDLDKWRKASRQHEFIKDWCGRMRHPDDMYYVNDNHVTGHILKTSCVCDWHGRYHFKGYCVKLGAGSECGQWALKEDAYLLKYGCVWANKYCLSVETVEWFNGERIHPKSIKFQMENDECEARDIEANRNAQIEHNSRVIANLKLIANGEV